MGGGRRTKCFRIRGLGTGVDIAQSVGVVGEWGSAPFL